ncbi:MAG: YncE family protein [Candidatus Velthaea sp.]
MKKTVVLAAAAAVVIAVGYAWRTVGAGGPALPLRSIGDYPLSGNATRFDYASLDAHGILWLAHMGDGAVVAFDVNAARVVRTLPISASASVRGILAARGNVYAAAQGLGAIVVFDGSTGKRLAVVAAGDVDGLAYDPITGRIFVSDESGGRDTVIDGRTNRVVAAIKLDGEAGNTQYDSISKHVFVAVQTRDELAEIDPAALKVIRRYPLTGCRFAHSVVIDTAARAAYVGCQHNFRLVRLDLHSAHVTGSGAAGVGIDVLALDAAHHRLYVASESGVVSLYDVGDGALRRIAQGFLALHAHVVAVDPTTHRVYFPLENAGGAPVLRVMEPR